MSGRSVSFCLASLMIATFAVTHAETVEINFDDVSAPGAFHQIFPGLDNGPTLEYPEITLQGCVILTDALFGQGATSGDNICATCDTCTLGDDNPGPPTELPGNVSGVFTETATSIDLDVLNGFGGSSGTFTLRALDGQGAVVAVDSVVAAPFQQPGFVQHLSLSGPGIKSFRLTTDLPSGYTFAMDTLVFEKVPEGVETHQFDLPTNPLGIFGLQFTADFLGPPTGTIVEARAELDYSNPGPFDAADLLITLQAPSVGVPVWELRGADLGWSGSGNFTASLATDLLNGPIDLGDPPPDFSLFLLTIAADPLQPLAGQFVDSYFQIDVVPGAAEAGRVGSLLLGKAGLGQLELSWGASCLVSDTDYAVYEGSLGDFASHSELFCSTAGATTKTFSSFALDTYYLVVPLNSTSEGSYGATSTGAERPVGITACLPQQAGACE